MKDPFHIVLCEDSLKTVLIFLCAYGLGIGIFLSSRRNYRRGEEHGSAKWGDARAVNKKYQDRKNPFANRIFTQNVRMGLDGKKHRRNLNTLPEPETLETEYELLSDEEIEALFHLS